jgi:hypothetical protein
MNTNVLSICEEADFKALNRHFCQTPMWVMDGKYSSLNYKEQLGACKSLHTLIIVEKLRKVREMLNTKL